MEHVLGVCSNTVDDAFQFKTSFSKIKSDCYQRPPSAPTKRVILSVSMSLYDPFGLLATVRPGGNGDPTGDQWEEWR